MRWVALIAGVPVAVKGRGNRIFRVEILAVQPLSVVRVDPNLLRPLARDAVVLRIPTAQRITSGTEQLCQTKNPAGDIEGQDRPAADEKRQGKLSKTLHFLHVLQSNCNAVLDSAHESLRRQPDARAL